MTTVTSRKGIFIVGLHEFSAACGIGINPAIAFLIMASGSQGNNSISSWSCKAISERAGITKARAEKAVNLLIDNGLVEKIKDGTRPQYRLRLSDDKDSYIYLPNSIVDGVGNEVAPLERIRQCHNVMMLSIFVLLYYVQDIDNEHGIPVDAFNSHSDKLVKVYQNKMSIIMYCTRSTWEFNWQWYASSIFQRMGFDFNEFKSAFNELCDMGLITMWGITFESDGEDAEVICNTYTYSWFTDLHKQIVRKDKKLKRWPENATYVIVPKHVKEPDIRVSGRLTYLAQTTKTSRFYAMTMKREERVKRMIDNAVNLEMGIAITREEDEDV